MAHVTKPPPPLSPHRPDLPPAVDQVLARAMAKAPEHRYASCQQFGDALQEALSLPRARGTVVAAHGQAREALLSRTGTMAGHDAGPTAVQRGRTGGPASPSRPRRTALIALAVIAVLACALAAAHVLLGPASKAAGPARFTRIRAFSAPRPPGLWPFVSSVAFSRDGRTLAVGLTNETPASPDNSGTTSLWDVATGRRIATLGSSGGPEAFAPDGTMLAAVGGFGNSATSLWDTATRKRVGILADHQEASVENIAFSPNGTTLAAADSNGIVYLWSVPAQRVVRNLVDIEATVNSLAFSRSGTILAAGLGNNQVLLWNPATGQQAGTLTGAGDAPITSVAFSQDGSMIAASDQSGAIYLWNAATRRRIATFHDPGSYGADAVAFSPDGTMLATGDSDGSTYLWNLSARTLAGTLTNPAGHVTSLLTGESRTAVFSVAFSPDGKTLATADTNGSAYLWRIR
jgi:sugar lactone lactonase YvrE